jgi:hypothetical protein
MDSGTLSMMMKRIDKALELRRQHQVDEQQRQHEHQRQRTRGIAELAALAVEVGGVAGRQDLARGGIQESQRVSQSQVGVTGWP